MPAVFKKLEEVFGIGPSVLGTIGLIQVLCRGLSSPLWGILADHMSRKKLLAFGCVFWGLATFLVGTSESIFQLTLWRALCAIGLAIVAPVTQSIVADLFPQSKRGKAFGMLMLWGSVGGLTGMILSSAYSHKVVTVLAWQIDGWRAAHFIVGLISLALAAVITFGGLQEPERVHESLSPKPHVSPAVVPKILRRFIASESRRRAYTHFSESLKNMKSVMQNHTVLVLMTQGAAGCLPWSALAFGTMWFQYIGMTDFTAAVLSSTFMLGTALGGLFGGVAGDAMERRYPFAGRVMLAQVSVFAGIIMAFIVFSCIERAPDQAYTFAFWMFLFGFVCSWTSPGCNRPIFTNITAPRTRSTAFSMLVAVDGAFAAMGGPIVGHLSESVFGYQPAAKSVSDLSQQEHVHNINALASALQYTLTIPWLICGFSYGLLYWTYPRDLAQLKKAEANLSCRKASKVREASITVEKAPAEAAGFEDHAAKDLTRHRGPSSRNAQMRCDPTSGSIFL